MEERKKRILAKNDSDLVFGIRPVMEAIRSGKIFDKLFIQNNLTGELSKEILEQCKAANVVITKVPIEKLNRITRKNHQGVIGFISPIEFASIDHIIDHSYASGKSPLILVLDRITDVRNFGAIVRTAECAGVDAIIIPTRGAAQISSDAMKTSAGALNHVAICRTNNLSALLNSLKNMGLSIVACTEKTEDLLFSADLNQPIAIILGSEENGISQELLKISDQRAKIPINGKVASLNVATSAGIIVYEAVRQRS
jgi:23S rRNA (guanosine2251-2'-O)-methyltransferase